MTLRSSERAWPLGKAVKPQGARHVSSPVSVRERERERERGRDQGVVVGLEEFFNIVGAVPTAGYDPFVWGYNPV